ncbi:formyltransferase family protein [Halarchaeum salinum]|uniref:phosphoribosylglycinamide formyltransferase 1 n=1 Tax=Halarchaeum salinum TaxID=489912 RepID=A0AAV3S2Z5_9EURY
MKLAGMASNRGRNLRHIADRAPGGAEFAVILTNDADAPVLDAVAERDIPTEVVERDADESREAHEERVLDALSAYEFELVTLDGYMRVLTETFRDATPTTLNVHPSLLPSFPGADAHEQVLDADVSVSGATVHVVTDEVDAGPIVTQEPVAVYEDDDAASLKDRVLYDAEFKAYPRAVKWFAEGEVDVADGEVTVSADVAEDLPLRRIEGADRAADLRYGENPHQDAAVYGDASCEEPNVVDADQLNEGAKALSYNNYNDADGALSLIKEFEKPAAAAIKHTNPAGCATADTLAEAYEDAHATDPMSAFGGIISLNRPCDEATAELIVESFKEVVVAPGYTDAALDVLTAQENLRVLDVGGDELGPDVVSETYTDQSLVGGRLVQERDTWAPNPDDLEVVTEAEPTEAQIETMCFSWRVLKHVMSNGIVLAKDTETVGVGMGQVSRVDAVRLAAMKAEEHAEDKGPEGSVMASDAFFPFPDAIEEAAEAGVSAIIQPGGSKNDDAVIEAANEHGIAMALTGSRTFRHS